MSSAQHRLTKIIKRAKRLRRIDSNACRNILITIREVIEVEQSNERYTVTNLYCNWSLHNTVSKSLTALRALEAVSLRSLKLIKGQITGGQFIKFFSEQTFRPDALRKEIIQICRTNNVKDFLFTDDSNWSIFLALTLQDLTEKPIQFPEGADLAPNPSDSNFLKKSKKIYHELSSATQGERLKIFRKAWVSLDFDPWDDRPEDSKRKAFHCNIECFDQVTFKVKMTNIQPLLAADEYPVRVPTQRLGQ